MLVLVSPSNRGDKRIMDIEQTGENNEEPDREVLFSAVLHPHTSLGPNSFLALMAALCVISFSAGAAFIPIGARPVFGFFGLDILLIYLAFRASYYHARTHETVRLTENALAVEKTDPNGHTQRWEFQPYWLRVGIDNSTRSGAMLTLSSHGRTLEIGAFLTPEEKRDMERALEVELRRLRGQTT